MSNRRAFLCLLLAVLALSSLSLAVTPDQITGTVSGPTVVLKGNVHPKALPQYDQGPVDPAMRLGTITLLTVPTSSQQKAIKHLTEKQQDRKSSSYHRWLTPEQYADQFGLSPSDTRKIASWLNANGFSMVEVARGRNWVSFTGTAAQVQSVFGTEIHGYFVDGHLHYANATAPSIPVALEGVVVGIRGLHDFKPRPLGIRRSAGPRPFYNSTNFGDLVAPGDVATIYDINALYSAGIDGSGQKLAVMGQTDIYLADITDFRTGFGLSAISCTTNSNNVITACSDPHFQYVLGGTDPGLSPNGDITEADLDLEWSSAIARNAQIIYVNSQDTFTSYYYAIDHNLAPVISLSYGLCELGDQGFVASDEAELTKGNSEGITIVNSSGDSGVAECDAGGSTTATQGLAVSYPASSPEVTGVGGTAIPLANFTSTYWGTTNGTDGGTALSYIPEQAWNDDDEIGQFCKANSSNLFCKQGGSNPVPGWVPITSAQTAQEDIGISIGGGGVSNCATTNGSGVCTAGFAQPSYQSSLTIPGQASGRFSPDVSLLASPNFPGYIICTQLSELGISGTGSSCASGISNSVEKDASIIGGTSASAPVFAGMVALLNQYLNASGGLGNINPMLYTLAATSSNGAFNSVTSDNSVVYCTAGTPSAQAVALRCPSAGFFGYQASNADATTHYNLVTGLGSVDANKLAIAWAASLSSFTVSSGSASPSSISAGNNATTTVTVAPTSGTPGTVTFSCPNAPSGISCSFNPTSVANASGSTQLTIITQPYAAAATDSITVQGTSGGSSSSTTVSLTVTATTESFTLAIQGGNPQVSQGATASVNITVTGANGFSPTNSPLTYTCTTTAPETTCIYPTGPTNTSTISVQLKTTAPTAAVNRRASRIFYAALLPGLLGILFTVGSHRRSPRGMRVLGLIMFLGCSTLWLGSCGGSSGGGISNPGTPVGSYSVTVGATTGGAAPVTNQVQFMLNVVQ